MNLKVLVVKPLLLTVYPGTLRSEKGWDFHSLTVARWCTVYSDPVWNPKLLWSWGNLERVPGILTYWSLLGQECAPPKVPLTPLLWKNMRDDSSSKMHKEPDLWNQICPWRIASSPWIQICHRANQPLLSRRGRWDICSPELKIIAKVTLQGRGGVLRLILTWSNDH